ncbi:7-carboxy-7-deazaguanine synthase QueE [Deferribacterales bacterium RsTz2092]|nr:7-carboxy-7-deazaguanine synthase [Deferribacterales bacterium]
MSQQLANVVSIFDSIQGEGRYVGARQLFVRLAGCPLACPYCDTDHTAPQDSEVSAQDLAELLTTQFQVKLYHSISITGGEPLLYPDFLRQLAKILHTYEARLFLETSGYDTQALLNIAGCFDYLSVDLKWNISPFEEHTHKLLKVISKLGTKKAYIKIPLPIEGGLEIVQQSAPIFKHYGIAEVWLQSIDNVVDTDKIAGWQRVFANYGVRAFFVPQVHKLIGVE